LSRITEKGTVLINFSVGAALASAPNTRAQASSAPTVCALDNMELSPIGKIIDRQWNDIPNQYPYIGLDEYVIMPNHFHGIMIIEHPNKTGAEASAAPTISKIIRAFKSKCAAEYLKYIQQNSLNVSAKIWQRSFYDHVIRTDGELNKIREYIANNPSQWENDEDNLVETYGVRLCSPKFRGNSGDTILSCQRSKNNEVDKRFTR
jgi:REP element-mobilizing transposase RayT